MNIINTIKSASKLKLILIVLAILVVGFVAKNLLTPSNVKPETATVKRGDLKETLTISGEVDAEEKATLRFQTSGYLTWIGVKEGDHVKKNQVIASLDQREVRKQLDKELQAYMSERWTFENTKDASGDPAAMTTAVRRALDQAQFNLNSSVLDVELQDLTVQFSNLWSPIEGLVVSAESPVAGVNITPTQAEFDIVNPKTVIFIAKADQTEVPQITASMSGELVLDAFPGQTFSGQVKSIGFSPLSGETGTVYAVKFNFSPDDSDYRYRLGMTGDLTFVTNEKKGVLYVPSKFISVSDSQHYVFVLRQKQKEKVTVKTGLETDSNTEIISGLSEGDLVTQ